MKHLTSILLLAFIALPAFPNGKDEKDVLAALENWKQAVMKKDRALFDKVLHADLAYGHSNGLIETKEQAIKHIVDSSVAYEAIDLKDTAVRISGNVAVMTGKMDYHQNSAGKKSVTNLAVLSVWVKGSKGWQMIGRQSTRPPAQ